MWLMKLYCAQISCVWEVCACELKPNLQILTTRKKNIYAQSSQCDFDVAKCQTKKGHKL